MNKTAWTTTTIALVFALLTGCAPTLPEHRAVSPGYNLLGTNTFAIQVSTERAAVEGLRAGFAKDYAPLLESHLRIALKNDLPGIAESKKPDLLVDVAVEQLIGGSAAARFLVGMGAGRSVTNLFVRISRDGKPIAERRFAETTTIPNLTNGVYGNESAMVQDAPLIANKIARWIKDPQAYDLPKTKEAD